MIPEILSETGRIFFVILGHFLPFYPSNPKNQNFAKIKKLSGDIIILHVCTIMAVIWCMVPEIWSMTNRIFCHFGLFFALLPPWQPKKSNFWKNEKKNTCRYHFTQVYHTQQSYNEWFLGYQTQQTEFFVILDHL